MSDIYNPKFKTKQIFNLSTNVTGNPSDDEIYFWVTFENSKLYANYRLPGEENDRKYHITDPISFNPEQNFSNKVNSISFDATNFLIRYFNDNGSVGIPLENILIDDEIVFNENSITFPVSQNKTRVVNVPNVLKKHIVSGNFSNKTLYLNYNTNEQISIDMSNVSSNMSYNDSNSIDLNVSGNSLSANVKISNDQNNQLQIKNDGLFVSTPNINGNGISALLFDVPTINNNQVFHFKIQFSNDKTFSNELNIVTYDTSVSQTGFEVFTGLGLADFPSSGLTSDLFSEEQIKFSFNSADGIYYRYQWLISEDGEIFQGGKFRFGQTNAI